MKVGIFSDVHANLGALEAVLTDAEQQGCRGHWFLGDVVGYGPQPVACVERVMACEASSADFRWVAGNHDLGLHGNGVRIGEDLGELASQTLLAHRNLLNERDARQPYLWHKDKSQLIKSDPIFVADRSQIHYILAHADLLSKFRTYMFLKPGSDKYPLSINFRKMVEYLKKQQLTTVCLFIGHTHVPGVAYYPANGAGSRDIDFREHFLVNSNGALGEGLFIVNPGSVGTPRDGDPRAAYLILDRDSQQLTARRVAYDIEQTIAAMGPAGFNNRLIDCLSQRLRTGK